MEKDNQILSLVQDQKQEELVSEPWLHASLPDHFVFSLVPVPRLLLNYSCTGEARQQKPRLANFDPRLVLAIIFCRAASDQVTRMLVYIDHISG